MDLDEGLGSHVEEFARELGDDQNGGNGGGSGSGKGNDDEDFEDYGEIEYSDDEEEGK